MISIVIPTLGRKQELLNCLDSILNSSYRDYEVIVVDQNHSSLLDESLNSYKQKLTIAHLKVDFRGAAQARNYGAMQANGDILFFPDDDAEIFPNTLENALLALKTTNSDVVFGKCIDREGNDSVIAFNKKSDFLSIKKYEGMFIEATMFIKRKIFLSYLFDNELGVGTFYGAEEAHDLLIRILSDNILVYFTPEIKIYHPQKISNHSNPSEIRRVFTYRCGFAKLCKKHKLRKKYYKRLLTVLLYLPYTLFFCRRKTRYYLAEILGLITGKIV